MIADLFPDLIVNHETIPRAAVAREAQNHPAPKGKPGLAWRQAANALALRALLLQEAARRGLTPDPAEIGPGRFETEEEALIRALLDAAIETDAPTPEAVRAEWARDPGRFRVPPLWEAAHILCACDPRDAAATEAARVRAGALTERARAEPAAFARLAAAESDCGSKASGGALGQLGPGDVVPEFAAALRAMVEGEIAGPIPTRQGWHVIRLDACAQGAILPYEAIRPMIAEAMEKAAWARAARDFVDGLVRAAEISGAGIAAGPGSGPGIARSLGAGG